MTEPQVGTMHYSHLTKLIDENARLSRQLAEARAELDNSCDAYARTARALETQLAEAQGVIERLRSPIGLYWLGEKHEGTGCAKDNRGCVAYFKTQADCEAFMDAITAQSAAMGTTNA